MNPILAVTILGSLMPDLDALDVPGIAIAVGITGGWALTGGSSPFTATSVLIGRIANVSPLDVGVRWNGLYTLVAAMLLSLYVTLLAFLL